MSTGTSIEERLTVIEQQQGRIIELLEKQCLAPGYQAAGAVDIELIKDLARRTAKYGKGVVHDFNARR